ncbi:MAG: type II toxin-antitoxin system VapC family toxin [Candidatus Dormibacteria bacterium]
MIVLDTDAISGLMRPRPDAALVGLIGELAADEQATTAVTLGELAYGAHRVHRPDLYARALRLLAGFTILPFDAAAAEWYGEVRSRLEAAGERLDDPDLRIAATVLVHDATLVTGNTRHFARVSGLAVRTWAPPPG